MSDTELVLQHFKTHVPDYGLSYCGGIATYHKTNGSLTQGIVSDDTMLAHLTGCLISGEEIRTLEKGIERDKSRGQFVCYRDEPVIHATSDTPMLHVSYGDARTHWNEKSYTVLRRSFPLVHESSADKENEHEASFLGFAMPFVRVTPDYAKLRNRDVPTCATWFPQIRLPRDIFAPLQDPGNTFNRVYVRVVLSKRMLEFGNEQALYFFQSWFRETHKQFLEKQWSLAAHALDARKRYEIGYSSIFNTHARHAAGADAEKTILLAYNQLRVGCDSVILQTSDRRDAAETFFNEYPKDGRADGNAIAHETKIAACYYH